MDMQLGYWGCMSAAHPPPLPVVRCIGRVKKQGKKFVEISDLHSPSHSPVVSSIGLVKLDIWFVLVRYGGIVLWNVWLIPSSPLASPPLLNWWERYRVRLWSLCLTVCIFATATPPPAGPPLHLNWWKRNKPTANIPVRHTRQQHKPPPPSPAHVPA